MTDQKENKVDVNLDNSEVDRLATLKLEMRDYLAAQIKFWLSFVGIGTITGLIAAFCYIFFVLPHTAVQQATGSILAEIQQQKQSLNTAVQKTLDDQHSAQARLSNTQAELDGLLSEVAKTKARLGEVGSLTTPQLVALTDFAKFYLSNQSNLDISLTTQVSAIRRELDNYYALPLAALTIREGVAISSSKDVNYDAPTGVVTFPNPKKLRFVPIVSDLGKGPTDYITATHFIQDIGANQFKVARVALDTGGRTSPPSGFTVIVIGIP